MDKILVQAYLCMYIADFTFKQFGKDELRQHEKQAFKTVVNGLKTLMLRMKDADKEQLEAIHFTAGKIAQLLNVGIDIIEKDEINFEDMIEDMEITYNLKK